jgi:hypothetical protein
MEFSYDYVKQMLNKSLFGYGLYDLKQYSFIVPPDTIYNGEQQFKNVIFFGCFTPFFDKRNLPGIVDFAITYPLYDQSTISQVYSKTFQEFSPQSFIGMAHAVKTDRNCGVSFVGYQCWCDFEQFVNF